MFWVNVGLISLVVALASGLASLIRPQLWSLGRVVVPLGLQIAGIFIVTWLLVQRGASLAPTLPPPAEQPREVWMAISAPAAASLDLIAVAILLGTGVGTAAAAFAAWKRSAWFASLLTVASLVWIVPAFLVAILAQDLQSVIYGVIGVNVSGGYGRVTVLQILWCAAVLAVRPAAYSFRQGQVLIGEQAHALFVRTAFAKGLPWRAVVWRHIIRPAAAGLLQTSINSIRLIVGLLPLVEFFFAYPGLGRLLLLSLGVPPGGDQPSAADPAVAIAAAVVLALVVVVAELPLRFAAVRLDPRLAEA